MSRPGALLDRLVGPLQSASILKVREGPRAPTSCLEAWWWIFACVSVEASGVVPRPPGGRMRLARWPQEGPKGAWCQVAQEGPGTI